MRRWPLLLLLLSACAAPSLLAACSGGGAKSEGATVVGRVQNELGTPIAGASVLLDDESTITSASGEFRIAAKPGRSQLEVTAQGYRPLSVELRIASGDNEVDIILVVCTPGIDAGCGTPPPTTPSPAPTPNVLASHVGVNANAGAGFPNGFGNWTGRAALQGATRSWMLGDSTDSAFTMGGSDLSFSECWADAAETTTYNGAGTPDHCSFWWDGDDEGQLGMPDAVFYVRIPGAVFVATPLPHTITFADGMTAGYYEGTFPDPFVGSIGTFTLLHAASSGTLVLSQNGTLAGNPVSISGDATFYIPGLP